MQELIQKIESYAAERLVVPEGRRASEEMPRFKAFLKVETHRLKLAHHSGKDGRAVCAARACVLDVLLRALWNISKSTMSAQAQKEFPSLALVAIGGYGRAELNPHSDVDFMFLHQGQVAAGGQAMPHLARLVDGVLYPLWDLRLKVGHSVRGLDDCVREANRDMQSKTSMIEARLIVGDQKLFEKFQALLLAKSIVRHEEEYIAARLEDQASRRTKFGNSACMQEPNLKNGCGGLRDYQNLLWMAFVKYQTRSLEDLQKREFVMPAERRELEAAYEYLLRTRTELHYHANRPVDVLGKSVQPAIASGMGFGDRSPSRRIEKFMRLVYTHMRNIHLITRTLEQRMALLPSEQKRFSFRALLPRGRAREVETVDGFKFINGEIHAASNRIFRDSPRRLMRVFLHAQQRGLKLHPDLAQLIRNQVSLVDREFLNDEHVRETFLEILNQRGNVAATLRAMHEVDFLGKYVPEFGKLTCLVQHEFYHQYTADEHTLMCIEQLDRVWAAELPMHRNYAPLFQAAERPFLLYLALLLHDTGKPGGHGHHEDEGAKLALRVARRLRLDESARDTLALLIEHHLLLASVSQRRDLDDPRVIEHVANRVRNPETMQLLTLHTFVDALATSDKLWNGFKDSLLRDLHRRAMPLLTGDTDFIRAEEKHRERLLTDVCKAATGGIEPDEVRGHFDALPARYFQIHTAEQILEDVELVHEFVRRQVLEDHPFSPVVRWRNDADRGGSVARNCTWDRPGLFSKLAGCLSASGLNILSAQIFTRNDGIALDTFFVTDARSGNLAEPEQRVRFSELIDRVLTGEEIDLHGLIARQQVARPLFQGYAGENIPTQIRFDNDASETRTLMEIETEDRLGLLYTLAQTLAESSVDISAARICTEKGAAIDTFYVQEADSGKLVSPERLRVVERQLRHAIHGLDLRGSRGH
jgi:[protein-PII] uridylyltransferase